MTSKLPNIVQTAISAAFSHEVLVHPNGRSVLESIAHCDMVHALDLFNSCLLLQHGPFDTASADPLSVQVSETNLGRVLIAYLSAF